MICREENRNCLCAVFSIVVVIAFMWTVVWPAANSDRSENGSGDGSTSTKSESRSTVFFEHYGWLIVVVSACICYCGFVPLLLAVCPCFSSVRAAITGTGES